MKLQESPQPTATKTATMSLRGLPDACLTEMQSKWQSVQYRRAIRGDWLWQTSPIPSDEEHENPT